MRAKCYCLLLLLIALAGSNHFCGAGEDYLAESDLQTLRDFRIPATPEGAAAFLKPPQISAEKLKQLRQAVAALASPSFRQREDATRLLMQQGDAVAQELKTASDSTDAEVRFRSRYILEKFAERLAQQETLASVVLRTIARNRWPGLGSVLLESAPLEPEISQLRLRESALLATIHPEDADFLRQFLAESSRSGVSRGLSLTAWASLLEDAGKEDLLPYLQDEQPQVRLAAVRGVVNSHPRDCLPVLLNLLESENASVRTAAASILRKLTGRHFGYASYDSLEARKDSVQKWRQWIEENGKTAELHTPLEDVEPLRGRILLCHFNPFLVTELDMSGKLLFSSKEINAPCAAVALSDGRRVFADWGTREIVALAASGEVEKRHPLKGTPNGLQILESGNMLVCLFDANIVQELTPEGKILWEANVGGSPTGAERLPSGNTLVALYSANRVVELDKAGKEVWQAAIDSPESARRLSNGNTLVASGGGQAAEISPQGKIVWSAAGIPHPYDACLLESGNLLVGYSGGLREIDRSGKLIREFDCSTVRRICVY